MNLTSNNQTEKSKYRLVIMIKLCILLILILPSTAAVKRYLVDKGFVAQQQTTSAKAKQLLTSLLHAPLNYFKANSALPVLKLDIKYQDWLKLEEDRRLAFEHGVIPEIRQSVAATINFDGQMHAAKVRLQGDMLDHVDKADRWSLKVELKKKKAIFSSRRFALVAPSVRVNQGPSLFSKTMELAGFDIIAPKLIPVSVVLNSVDWGTMLLEQSFSQDLLAVNNRTEGLIVRLDLEKEFINEEHITRLLKPRVLQSKTVLANQALAKQRKIALTLVKDFIEDKRPASDVFNAEKLGQYLATVDLWGAWHALTWNNWRWYYNPHYAKLEPIQSDVAVTPASHIWLMKPPSHTFALSKKMLKDKSVKAHYNKAKSRLTSTLESFIVPKLSEYEQTLLSTLHHDSPMITPFNYQVMTKQAWCWQTNYTTSDCKSIKEVSSELHKQMQTASVIANWDLVSQLSKNNNNEVSLNLINNQTVPLEIKSIEGTLVNNDINELSELNDALPLTILPNHGKAISLPKNIASVSVRAALKNQKSVSYHFMTNTPALSFIPRGAYWQTNLEKYHNVFSVSGNTWQFNKGHWHIDDYLVTPENTNVIIPKGTKLTFAKHAGLMVIGKLDVEGTERHPVIMTKQKQSKKWAGLSVFAANQKTVQSISNLQISYASSPKLGLWQPRGAIYFVGGHVDATNLSITDNQSEDGLNIINAAINIQGLTIKNALSDAFDCDFCTGIVRNSHFSEIGFRSGGDGIDVSGSNLTLIDAHFNTVRDKAISAGERSQLTVENVTLENVNFGLVSKDDSIINAKGVIANNINHKALMSYSKKPIFGPASLYIESFNCYDDACNQKLTAQTGSELNVNGQSILAQALNVSDMYNTIMKSDKPQ